VICAPVHGRDDRLHRSRGVGERCQHLWPESAVEHRLVHKIYESDKFVVFAHVPAPPERIELLTMALSGSLYWIINRLINKQRENRHPERIRLRFAALPKMALRTGAQSGDSPGRHERTTDLAPPFHASALLVPDFKPAY
jgi:hypothetical protein